MLETIIIIHINPTYAESDMCAHVTVAIESRINIINL